MSREKSKIFKFRDPRLDEILSYTEKLVDGMSTGVLPKFITVYLDKTTESYKTIIVGITSQELSYLGKKISKCAFNELPFIEGGTLRWSLEKNDE